MKDVLLALDLGTKCGWGVFLDGKPIASGTWLLQKDSQRRFEGGGMKWLRFRKFLEDTAESIRVTRVAIEEVRRHMSVNAAHAYGGALAVLSAWCEEHSIPYESIPVQTIKKHATGKGNAKKEAMVIAAQKRWPERAIADSDDDQADALWIGDCVSARDKLGVPAGGEPGNEYAGEGADASEREAGSKPARRVVRVVRIKRAQAAE